MTIQSHSFNIQGRPRNSRFPTGVVTPPIGDLSVLRAFPGAYGFGAESVGGRSGLVIEVTNLNDSGAGSLRQAVQETSGPRTVIFRVSGTIDLNTTLRVFDPNITIAGQTAPGGGICLRRNPAQSGSNFCPLTVHASDVVVQHLRLRPGDAADSTRETNAFTVLDGSRIIVDHCSLSWANDEVVTLWTAGNDITIQNCIVSEALRVQNNTSGAARAGFISGSRDKNVAIYNSLIMSNRARNPQIDHSLITDIRNCLIYNWETGAFTLKEGTVNLVNTFFRRGPDSSSDVRRAGLVTFGLISLENIPSNSLYIENSELLGFSTTDVMAEVSSSERNRITVSSPFGPVPFQPEWDATYSDLVDQLIPSIGASLPVRDSVDARLIEEFLQGEGAIIELPSDVGGWPILLSGTPYAHSGDGIANWWKEQNGLSVSTRYNDGPGGSAQVNPVIDAPWNAGVGWTYLDLFLSGMNLP